MTAHSGLAQSRTPDKTHPNVIKGVYKRRSAVLRELGFSSYAEYLKSEMWAGIRARVLELADSKCVKCGGLATQVHHANYRLMTMIGRQLGNLLAVCGTCHRDAEFSATKKTYVSEANERLGIARRATYKCQTCGRERRRTRMESLSQMLCHTCAIAKERGWIRCVACDCAKRPTKFRSGDTCIKCAQRKNST